jgi:hypothetical protein
MRSICKSFIYLIWRIFSSSRNCFRNIPPLPSVCSGKENTIGTLPTAWYFLGQKKSIYVVRKSKHHNKEYERHIDYIKFNTVKLSFKVIKFHKNTSYMYKNTHNRKYIHHYNLQFQFMLLCETGFLSHRNQNQICLMIYNKNT